MAGKNRPTIAMKKPRRWDRLSSRCSSCLLFQMLGVETFSFLANLQSNRRNLMRQCEKGHGQLDSASDASGVEILKGAGTLLALFAVLLKRYFRSWLWFLFRPRTLVCFFARCSWPST